MSKIDFQDGGCGGHLGFSVVAILDFLSAHLAILCLISTLVLIIKFRFKFQFNWIMEEMSKI